jgi:hypothetical protein
MSYAERCPVCNGAGKVYTNYYDGAQQKTCHGCSGTGWVTVWDITDQPAPWTCGETNKNAPATVDWKASYLALAERSELLVTLFNSKVAEAKRYREALNKIAAWNDGILAEKQDCPERIARETLKEARDE